MPMRRSAWTRENKRDLASSGGAWPVDFGSSGHLSWLDTGWSMREIGAFEAKNVGQLLDLVEQGEEITITRREGSCAPGAGPTGTQPRSGPRSPAAHARAGRAAPARSLRLERMESLP